MTRLQSFVWMTTVLLVLSALVPSSAAAPPPEGVCGVCGEAFERVAEREGVDTTVLDSDLQIRITDDSTSQWTAHITVDQSASDRFGANETLLDHVVASTFASSRTVVDDPQNRSVRLDDQTVTVSFTVANASRRYPGDVLLFDSFVRYPPDGVAFIDADRLTVVGPPGTAVTHAPPGGMISGNRIVWTASGDDRTYSPRLGRDASIVFAPGGGIISRAFTSLAVRSYTLRMLAPELRAYALVPSTLLAFVAAGLLVAGKRPAKVIDTRRKFIKWSGASVALYVVVSGLAFFVIDTDLGIVFGAIGIGLILQTVVTVLVGTGVERLHFDSNRDSATISMVAVVAWTLALVLGAPTSALLVVTAGPVVFLLFGVLASDGHWSRLLFPVIVALGPVVASLPLVPRVGVVFVSPSMMTVLFVGSALLGSFLYAIGWRVSESNSVFSTGLEHSSRIT